EDAAHVVVAADVHPRIAVVQFAAVGQPPQQTTCPIVVYRHRAHGMAAADDRVPAPIAHEPAAVRVGDDSRMGMTVCNFALVHASHEAACRVFTARDQAAGTACADLAARVQRAHETTDGGLARY